jgi:asparagine synthase (glutamine-hydrolysing)
MGSLAVALLPRAADGETARRMLRAAPHRGTELEVRTHGRLALGVASSDERPDASIASRGETLAALVGDLDNREDVDRALVRAGFEPGRNGPASTVLAAFRAWGDAAPARFRGAFAGVVSDGDEVRLFRDQLGLRTLYSSQGPEGFFAATEPKQVVAGAGRTRRADADALADVFFCRLDTRATAVSGVERVLRGEVTTTDGTRVRTSAYWNPAPLVERTDMGIAEACERFVELLEQAVERSLRGNDAISLSGGIDSPAIAGVAAPLHAARYGSPLRALTAVYPDQPSVDERSWVELVSQRLDMPLTTYVPTARPLDDLAFWVDRLDGPVEAVSVPEIAENYRRARGLGSDNVLTGELAEYVISVRNHLIAHFLLHGRFGVAQRWLREERERNSSWRAVARSLAPSLTPPRAARAWLALRRRDDTFGVPSWVDASVVGAGRPRPDLDRPARSRWREAQLDPLRGAATTVEGDELVAASCGVTVRRPLADVDLWEFMLGLRAETKFPERRGKAFVRRAMRGRVPDEILDRHDKTAFDEHALATADYGALERWVVRSDVRLDGVDYARLRGLVERRELSVLDLMWSYDLARVHAFAEVAG